MSLWQEAAAAPRPLSTFCRLRRISLRPCDCKTDTQPNTHTSSHQPHTRSTTFWGVFSQQTLCVSGSHLESGSPSHTTEKHTTNNQHKISFIVITDQKSLAPPSVFRFWRFARKKIPVTRSWTRIQNQDPTDSIQKTDSFTNKTKNMPSVLILTENI